MTKFKTDKQFFTVAYKCSLNPIHFFWQKFYHSTILKWAIPTNREEVPPFPWCEIWLFIRNRIYCILGPEIPEYLLLWG